MNDKNSIPGIPDGLEVIAFREAKYEETYLDGDGRVRRWPHETGDTVAKYLIVQKIEKPKRYRPFANGDEFKPHRDKWWKWKAKPDCCYPPTNYSDKLHSARDWEDCFNAKVFDDGTPFGVEVNE